MKASMKISKHVVLLFGVLILLAITSAAQTGQKDAASCRPPKLSTRDDSTMFGRLIVAIEDLGGGYYKEAEGRYSGIVRDIDKKVYHPCLQWMAYDGYGQTLTALKKKDKAIVALTHAVELAKNLSPEEQKQSAQHLDAAQTLN